jgi:hypothetical protein
MYRNSEKIAKINSNLTTDQIDQIQKSISFLRKAILLNQLVGPGNIITPVAAYSGGLWLSNLVDNETLETIALKEVISVPVLCAATDLIQPVAEYVHYKQVYDKDKIEEEDEELEE